MRLFRRSPDPLPLAKRHITGLCRVSAAVPPWSCRLPLGVVVCWFAHPDGETCGSFRAYTKAAVPLDGLDGVWLLLEIESCLMFLIFVYR
jgi:Na+-driven multidrug efflux pump